MFTAMGMLQSRQLIYVILIRHRLNTQINLGISMREVYKDLGRKMAS